MASFLDGSVAFDIPLPSMFKDYKAVLALDAYLGALGGGVEYMNYDGGGFKAGLKGADLVGAGVSIQVNKK